ncbi:MAG: hypothetical protein IAE82_09935 [Opitutaceae bacterium]|nr:hypothetical protein [Opitutaceae bacterium]
MVRLPVFLLLLVAAAALPAWAQIQPRSLQTIDDPKGEFSLSLRFSGNVEVSFRDVGTLGSSKNIGDVYSEWNRSYDDGAVAIDQRKSSDGADLPDDGRTNTWRVAFDSQLIDEDGDGLNDGIAFHRYETRGDGATVAADSTQVPGIDFDYSYAFGKFGGRLRNKSPRATWGGTVGGTITSINAKSNDSIVVTLLTTEDRYSLDGAVLDDAPYTAPSSSTSTGTDSDGNTVTNTVDTTILLANRPYRRVTPEERPFEQAEVEGFWQVRGGALTARAGLWARFRPHEKLGVRVSAGLTASFLGLTMRYDEWLDKEELVTPLRHQSETSPDKWLYYGAYGSADAELWLTGSTALFIGATYEKLDEDISIPLDGRTADIRLGSGTGFRLGFTKLF